VLVTSRDLEDTLRIGETLGQLLNSQHLVCLSGDLGAGKTTFARGVGRGWGTTQRITSPTFTIVNVYQRPDDQQQLYHIDAYRLHSSDAVFSIGFDDILAAQGPILIEWPQHLLSVLPKDCLWITLEIQDDDEQRLLTFEATGPIHQDLLQCFNQQMVNWK